MLRRRLLAAQRAALLAAFVAAELAARMAAEQVLFAGSIDVGRRHRKHLM